MIKAKYRRHCRAGAYRGAAHVYSPRSLLPLAGEGARRADEGGAADNGSVLPTATLTRRAVRAGLSR